MASMIYLILRSVPELVEGTRLAIRDAASRRLLMVRGRRAHLRGSLMLPQERSLKLRCSTPDPDLS